VSNIKPIEMSNKMDDVSCLGKRKRGLNAGAGGSPAVRGMSVYLEILGTAGNSSPSIFLVMNDRRFLFNCGEGVQRLCIEHKIRLKKIERIFLTRLHSDAFGGVPGMMLSIGGSRVGASSIESDSVPELNVSGPLGTSDLFNATQSFCHVSRKDLKLRFIDVSTDGRNRNLGNEIVRVSPVTIVATEGRSDVDREISRPQEAIVCYLCSTPTVRGRFQPEKAMQLNVPKGPLFGRLTQGMSVVLSDGSTINPEDCMDPPSPGSNVAIVHCPDPAWISSLAKHASFATFREDRDGEGMACIVHVAPMEVLRCPTYVSWARSFGESTRHIIINEDVCPRNAVLVGASEDLRTKNRYVPVVYPNAYFDTDKSRAKREISIERLAELWSSRIVAGENLLRFDVAPRNKRGLNRERVLTDVRPTSKCLRGLAVPLTVDESFSSSPDTRTALSGRGVTMTFLGTASALPQKYRNVSSIFVRFLSPFVDAPSAMLLDCGEGTFGQLARLFRSEGAARRELSNLACVWISHMHADHHLGLISVLENRPRGSDMIIVGPRRLRRWLEALVRARPRLASTFRFVNASTFDIDSVESSTKTYRDIQAYLSRRCGVRMTTTRVRHPASSSGIALVASKSPARVEQPRWKFVYSGDTAPCQRLVRLGMNATLLVHEATFEDGMETDASAKLHSTVGQALRAAQDMRAYMTILTHFSARYPKTPLSGPTSTYGAYCMAGDFFTVRSEDIPKLPAIQKALVRLGTAMSEEMASAREISRKMRSKA